MRVLRCREQTNQPQGASPMPPEFSISVAELVKSFGQFHERQPKVLTTSATKLVPLGASPGWRLVQDNRRTGASARRLMHSPSNRSGFSLIEIIIATAILMGSVVVLARLAGMGRSMAQRADALSNAQRICERTLNEIVLGERPLQAVNRSILEPVAQVEPLSTNNDSSTRVSLPGERWLHSVWFTPLQDMPELVRLTVTVEPDTSGESIEQPVDEVSAKNKNRFTLSRWIRNLAGDQSNGNALEFAGGF